MKCGLESMKVERMSRINASHLTSTKKSFPKRSFLFEAWLLFELISDFTFHSVTKRIECEGIDHLLKLSGLIISGYNLESSTSE